MAVTHTINYSNFRKVLKDFKKLGRNAEMVDAVKKSLLRGLTICI